ncbi:cupin domain-containing protein [Flexilinea flocculi]|jgi:mannose-6-phosphate isomerase-like protein (cupin superfamily)|uniref:Protein containing cupin domain n=1 Tax=Flexilinea flocculi TaxID=1678840 RepID=A0A0S7BX09_9CHLR|nr:cupin domain-containing protein [Flexilinea flocculi]NMB93509.1 cupin domain-containing protein [Flexilinea flocculi]GAP41478.1 protein containing cupin domain [Flexilinea flocculi]
MTDVIVTSKDDARIWMEDQEVCREYYKTDKITFGMSELQPGAVGAIDPGHAEAHEVFFCVQGEVLCYVSQDNKYYHLKEGDAMLVPQGKDHKLFNIGDVKAILTWSCAPHQ